MEKKFHYRILEDTAALAAAYVNHYEWSLSEP